MQHINRRNFLKFTGTLAAALGIGAAGRQVSALPVPNDPPHTTPQQAGMSADEMDAMHEKGVKAFVDNIGKDKDFWGVAMPFTMDGTTKVFKITCTEGTWELQPGTTVNAMFYNGRVPGEYIRVTQGDNVRIIAIVTACCSWDPCEKLIRATSSPASMSDRSTSGEADAGPNVQTIFVRVWCT